MSLLFPFSVNFFVCLIMMKCSIEERYCSIIPCEQLKVLISFAPLLVCFLL
jgi:hypothetical protein